MVQSVGDQLGGSWQPVLAACQHLVWLLAMKPNLSGGFRSSDSDATASNSTLTTAVLADIPVLVCEIYLLFRQAAMLNKVFESSSSLDEVALHHIIAALCKLSSESMMVSWSSPSDT